VNAIGLAHLSKKANVKGMQVEAREEYGKAVIQCRNLLLDPSTATSDEVLTAVNLMGLFEVQLYLFLAVVLLAYLHPDHYVFI